MILPYFAFHFTLFYQFILCEIQQKYSRIFDSKEPNKAHIIFHKLKTKPPQLQKNYKIATKVRKWGLKNQI